MHRNDKVGKVCKVAAQGGVLVQSVGVVELGHYYPERFVDCRRWQRASKLGLDPPTDVQTLLEASGADSKYNSNIWDGRV